MSQEVFAGKAVYPTRFRVHLIRRAAVTGVAGAAIAAVSLLASFSAPAQAQVYFRTWNERFVLYDDYPEFVGRREVRSILAEHGYRLRGRLRRNGQVYVADVSDRRGRPFRVIVDAIDGEIVQRFRSRQPPRPPGSLGRWYSNVDRTDDPGAGGPQADGPRELTPQLRKRSSQTANRTSPPGKSRVTRKPVRNSDKVIARRPLPPLEPAKPVAPPIVPDTPAAVAAPPASSGARPERKQANVPINSPILPPPEKPAPVIVPKTETSTPQPAEPKAGDSARPGKAMARTDPAGDASLTGVRTGKANVGAAKSDGAKSDGAKSDATRSGDTSVTSPAADSVEKAEKPQDSQPKVRVVGPPIVAPSTGPVNQKVKVAPLDNPGKRRDIEKPVGVAPLQ
jgi:hypothetical protein